MTIRCILASALAWVALGAWLVSAGCKREAAPTSAPAEIGKPGTQPAATTGELVLPEVTIDDLPFPLQTKFAAARREVRRSPDDPNKLADYGALCYVHGFPEAALVCFQRAAALQPERFLWWYYVGLIQERLGQTEQARVAYEKVVAQDERQLPAGIRLAALLIDKDPAKAAELFRRAATKEAGLNEVAGHFGLGRCAEVAGKADEAIAHYEAALKVAPNFGPAHAALAGLLESRGRAREAEDHRRRASGEGRIRPVADPLEIQLLQQGLDLETLLNNATALAQRQEFERAKELLKDAIDVDRSGVKARNVYGMVLGMEGRRDEAIAEFERLLNTPEGKDFLPAKFNLTWLLMQQNQVERAETLTREMLAQDSTYQDALRMIATIAKVTKQPDKALPALQASLTAAPQDAGLHRQVGILMDELGQKAAARQTLRKALELDPTLAAAHSTLGVMLYDDHRVEEARAAWSEALRLDPRLVQARSGLLTLYLEAKDWDRADQLLREGLEVAPDSPELANYLAWLLATCPDPKYRRPEEAVRWAEKAAKATGFRMHQMLDTLATAYAAVGRFDDARQRIAQAIELARAVGDMDNVEAYGRRQALFEKDQPYVESP